MLDDTQEEWRQVVGFPQYEVSSLGRVRRGERIRKLHTSKAFTSGYPSVTLCTSGKLRTFKVHRLVAAAFIGPALGLEVNHKNFDKADNRPANLEYVTRLENATHAALNGRYCPRTWNGGRREFGDLVSEVR